MYNENENKMQNEQEQLPQKESLTEESVPATEQEPVQNTESEQQPLTYTQPAAEQITMRDLKKQGYRPYTDPTSSHAEPPRKKKSGFAKKLASALALALIFGVVSGAVFLGMTGGFGNSDIKSGAPITEQDESNPPKLQGSVSGQLQSATTAMQEALQRAEIAPRSAVKTGWGQEQWQSWFRQKESGKDRHRLTGKRPWGSWRFLPFF